MSSIPGMYNLPGWMRYYIKKIFAFVASPGMVSALIIAGGIILTTFNRVCAQTQPAQAEDNAIKDLILPSLAITVEVPMPSEWQKSLKFLARNGFPEVETYRQKLLTSERVPMGTERIISPAYGNGTRYVGPRFKIEGEQKPTGISFYFDEYQFGFEFVNNLAVNPTVYQELTDEVDPETGEYKTIDKFKFTEEAGLKKAKEYIQKYSPGITGVGGEFSQVENYYFDKEKARPFVYRVTRTFRGVPLLDEYVQVAIDGEMTLVNLSYFWSPNIEPVTEDFKVIDPAYALMNAKRVVLADFNNNPPPLTLFDVRLGFVNHRTNNQAIVPVWLFDLKWNEIVRLQNPNPGPTEALFGTQVIERELVVAVDALKGGKFEMVPPQLKK